MQSHLRQPQSLKGIGRFEEKAWFATEGKSYKEVESNGFSSTNSSVCFAYFALQYCILLCSLFSPTKPFARWKLQSTFTQINF